MITNPTFYNNAVRRVVTAFGALFDDISIERKRSDGTVAQTLKVPISYAPKQRFYQMAEFSKTDDSTSVQVIWPRMAFEMTSIYYDSTRKVNSLNKISNGNEHVYAPVPYNITFSLYIGAKNTDDALQIVEQICPFFTPHFTVSIFELDSPQVSRDVPFTLQSVDFSDTFDGDPTQERTIFWTMNFIAAAYINGPSRDAKLIKRARVEMLLNGGKFEEITVVVNPETANRDDEHKIDVTITRNTE